jgi:hypothetical protein
MGITNRHDAHGQREVDMERLDNATPSDAYLEEALQDAQRLLKYAAEAGVDIDPHVRRDVAQARASSGCAWSEEASVSLLTALTQLAAGLRPVTAESLKACHDESRHAVRNYLRWAICLALVIVPFSIGSFVTSGFSEAISKDVVSANALAVKLVAQLHPPDLPAASKVEGAPTAAVMMPGLSIADVVTELQEFAALIRSIDYRARRLNAFVLFLEKDPFGEARGNAARLHHVFQLPAELPSHLEDAVDDRVVRYQDVRYFAQSLQEDVAMFYGAVATCLLPVLYALLGTCAYLLRTFEKEMTARTYVPSSANSARFLIAAISGGVVGLFTNLTAVQGASIPPLAIAFLAGYAVDVFFSFLESLIRSFSTPKTGEAEPAAKSAPSSPAPTPAEARA